LPGLILHVKYSEGGGSARTDALRSAGFDVLEASNDSTAVDTVQSRRPDLILLDPRVDEAAASGLCRAIQERTGAAAIPVMQVGGEGTDPLALIASIRSRLGVIEVRRRASQDHEAFEILESLTDAVVALDSDLRITYANAEAERRFGSVREQLIGKLFRDVDIGCMPQLAEENCRRAMSDRTPVSFETQNAVSDEFASVKVCPTRSGGVAVYFRDITDAKRTERTLANTRHRWMRLLDSSIIGIATSGANGIQYANDEFLRLVGYTREDLAAGSADWVKATPPEQLHLDFQAMKEMQERGECTPFEKEYVHADGTRIPILIAAAKLADDPLEWVAYAVDITARKRAEEALRLSQSRLQLAMECAEIGTWDMDLSSGTVNADEQTRRMFGFETATPLSTDWRARVHQDDRQRVSKSLEAALAGAPSYEAEYRVLHPQGIRWVYARGRVMRDAEARSVRLYGIAQDITERKRSEEQLREISERLDAHLSNTPIAVIEYNADFLITRWSGEAERMFGWTAAETIGKTFADIHWIHDEDLPQIESVCADLVSGRKTRILAVNRNYRKDRSVVHMEWYNSARLDAEGKFSSLLCLGIDVSDRKAAEAALERAALELRRSNDDLQQFAYAVSHDLQEPLRNVTTHVQMLQRLYGAKLGDGEAQHILSTISGGVDRMRKLIRDLLDYSRVDQPSAPGSGLVQMESVLGFALSNLAHAITESNAVITHDPLPDVKGDAIQVCQLLQNLVGNAIKYAKPGEPPRIHVSAQSEGEEWLFSICDNGIGIPPEHHDRIFGVFKRLHGREIPGSGIGLAICKKIIERRGGRIWVESEPGVGSTFYFTIPAVPL
jgi:PAS domain S-box-containing protein